MADNIDIERFRVYQQSQKELHLNPDGSLNENRIKRFKKYPVQKNNKKAFIIKSARRKGSNKRDNVEMARGNHSFYYQYLIFEATREGTVRLTIVRNGFLHRTFRAPFLFAQLDERLIYSILDRYKIEH